MRQARVPIANRAIAKGLVCLYAFAICFERIVEIEVFKPYRIVGLLLIAFAFTRSVHFGGFARGAAALLAIGSMLGLMTASFFGGSFPFLLNELLLLTFNLLTFIAVVSLLGKFDDPDAVMKAHIAGMLIAGISIFLGAQASAAEGLITREGGGFKNPAYACSSLFAAWAMLTYFLFRDTKAVHRRRMSAKIVFVVALAIAGLVACTYTGSRAGTACFILGVCVLTTLHLRSRIVLVFGLGVIALTLALYFGAANSLIGSDAQQPENILLRRFATKDASTDSRIYLWRAGMDATLDTFGLGMGLGQYRAKHQAYFAPYRNVGDIELASRDMSLHNEYLAYLAEFGVVGIFLYLILMSDLFRRAFRLRGKPLRAAFTAIIVVYLFLAWTHGAFVYFSFWVYAALIVYISDRERRALGVGNQKAVA